MDTKICSKCKTEKSLDDFTCRAASKDGRTGHCRKCRKVYRHVAKPVINKTKRNYYKAYLSDERVKETINIRKKLRQFVKNLSLFESGATIDNLGCTASELAVHLQQQAINNGYADFDIYNYDSNEYHLDHVRPLKLYISGKATVEELSHYTNVQILTKQENLLKGDTNE